MGGVIVPEVDPERLAAIGRQLDLPDGTLRALLYAGGELHGAARSGRVLAAGCWAEQDPLALHALLAPIWHCSTADPAVLDLMRVPVLGCGWRSSPTTRWGSERGSGRSG